MDENVTALLMALIFVSFVLTLILAMKSEADKTNDRDLVVEQVLQRLEEMRGEKGNGKT